MRYLSAVAILLTFNMLLVNCAPRGPITLEWGVKNHFCGSAIPIVMGLICHLPADMIPKQVEDTNKGGQVRRSIVDDCCKSACTPLHLQTYCHQELERTSTDQPTNNYY